MKIAILADNIFSNGGAGIIALNHAKAMKDLGFEVIIITTSQDIGEKHEEYNIKTYNIFSKYPPILRAYKSLNNISVVKEVGVILNKERPDIVHAHNIHYHISYRSLVEAKKYSKAVFLTIHDSMSFHYSKLFPEAVYTENEIVKSYKVSPWEQLKLFKWQYNPFRNLIIKKYLKIPDKIFAVSDALKQALQDNDISNVEVIHNGIDVGKWIMENKNEDNRKYIFWGGRLSRAKGGDVLIKSFIELVKREPNAMLLVVGKRDSYVMEIENKVKNIGIENNVIFTGSKTQDEMKSLYAKSTLVVVPSLCFDWFPTVILESMASGKPVIATCWGGAREMIIDGKTGFIINPKNEKEFTERILLFLMNKEKVEEMGKNSFERVKNLFSLDEHIKILIEQYDKFL